MAAALRTGKVPVNSRAQNRNYKYINRDHSIINTVKYNSAIVLTKSKALLSGDMFKVKRELSPEVHSSP